MTKIKTALIAAFAIPVLLVGCAELPRDELERSIESSWRVNLGDQISASTRQLSEGMATRLPKDRTIIVTSLSSVDNIPSSSAFGKTVSDRVSSELTRQGWKVVEVRLTNTLKISPAGEFMLSSDLKNIASRHEAQAVVVGTYSRTNASAFVTLKTVSLENSTAVSAVDFSTRIPVNTDGFFK